MQNLQLISPKFGLFFWIVQKSPLLYEQAVKNCNQLSHCSRRKQWEGRLQLTGFDMLLIPLSLRFNVFPNSHVSYVVITSLSICLSSATSVRIWSAKCSFCWKFKSDRYKLSTICFILKKIVKSASYEIPFPSRNLQIEIFLLKSTIFPKFSFVMDALGRIMFNIASVLLEAFATHGCYVVSPPIDIFNIWSRKLWNVWSDISPHNKSPNTLN